ncbi:hypothetical protein niasHS_003156 [Heterodera schachtii]|uniref:7TM GPCR serpentine receptor class x (Srx) domain-containing protein n=1 Tax=Heterodera schachtii TaxID=97005 RepID=A0ABD2KA03_HETSC
MTDLNNDTFYLTFKDANPSWSLIGCASILGLLALFGIIFNSSVIYITIRTKSFRGTVNYLLALCSFFELIHQSGYFLFVYTAFSGQNFIEYRLAVKITFIPWFGFAGVSPTMVFTGIDRLIGIAFDEMYNKFKIRLYLTTERRNIQAELALGARENIVSAKVRIECRIEQNYSDKTDEEKAQIRHKACGNARATKQAIKKIKNYFRELFLLECSNEIAIFSSPRQLAMLKKTRTIIRQANFDYEPASVFAFQRAFPEVHPKLCVFHVKQALNRRIQRMGLIDLYNSKEPEGTEFQRIVRKIGRFNFVH